MPDREKVIKGLNNIVREIVNTIGHGEAVPYLRTIDEAVALLKEQEPMQPKNIWHTIDHTSNGDCPKCGCEVNEFDNSMLCGRCGQSLDWRNL